MGKIELASLSDCTGCSVCHDVCPDQCISMNRGQKSFHKYPNIDTTKCIECGKCMRSCPIISPIDSQSYFKQIYYAAWNRNEQERLSSTSGGIGSALSEWGIKNGYIICGSAFDDNWSLSHKICSSQQGISKFKGSKYLQSNTTGIFNQIFALVKEGKKVIFIGTPCQIAGLLKVCGRYREQILLVDIICHGVNSPYVWQQYVSYLEGKYHSKLTSYNFRDKSHGWERKNGTPNLRVEMSFENGKKLNERAVYNQFHYWFGQHYILREACFNCMFRTKQRISDITIGDFWGVDKVIPQMDTFNGISVVIANTATGLEVIKLCDVEKEEVNESDAIKVLKGFVEKRPEPVRNLDISKMESFMQYYLSHDFADVLYAYKAPSKAKFFIERIKSLLKI